MNLDPTFGWVARHPTESSRHAASAIALSPRPPALALIAEAPRQADLVAWASAHRAALSTMRLFAPPGLGSLLAEQVGLSADPLPAPREPLQPVPAEPTARLVAALDALVAFTDPTAASDSETGALTRQALHGDIPVAQNRATADMVLAMLGQARRAPAADLAAPEVPEIARGAVKLWTVRATVDDVPGRLAILAASLARRAVNILSVQVHPTPDGPVDELLVAASPVLTRRELIAAVIDGGARMPRVTAADARALVDAPTRVLNLAVRLVRTPQDLPDVLTSLVPGAELTRHEEVPSGGEPPSGCTLLLTDPSGGFWLLHRPDVPFTPAECARVFGMMDLALARFELGS